MKINIDTRERATMLPTKYWATLINAVVASLALLLLQPSGAAAGTITFLDGTDSISVTVAGFGTRPAPIVSLGTESASVTINPPVAGATVTGGTDNNILEPAPQGEATTPGAISDLLKFFVVGPGGPGLANVAHFTFVSNAEGGAPLTPLAPGSSIPGVSGPVSITETGATQGPVATLTWSNGDVDTIFFVSDFTPPPPPVPEPSALLLLGSGLVGIALWSGRRLRRHAND